MRKIVWEKWVDPFLTNIDEFDLPDEDEDDDDEGDEEAGYRDSYQDAEELMRDLKKGGKPERNNTGPVIVGPMGIIPLNEHNIPSKIYTFWMGHTNFDVDEEVADTIDKTTGVETLDVFTRYRFRVAIGKAFLADDPYGKNVLLEIEKRLKCGKKRANPSPAPSKDITSKTNMRMLKNHLSKKYEYWAIYILPDGTLYPKGATSKEEVLEEGVNKHINAIATSWE